MKAPLSMAVEYHSLLFLSTSLVGHYGSTVGKPDPFAAVKAHQASTLL